MNKITLKKCDDDVIWVTSDDNPIGIESEYDSENEDVKMMCALAEYLGYEPALIFTSDFLNLTI